MKMQNSENHEENKIKDLKLRFEKLKEDYRGVEPMIQMIEETSKTQQIDELIDNKAKEAKERIKKREL